MLVQIRKLNIINEGYSRKISLETIYVNTDSIISISDYAGANEFLLTEGGSEEFTANKYSIVKLKTGNSSMDIIAEGSASAIYGSISSSGKRLLHD